MLRDYQERFVNKISHKLASGRRRIVAQLATGGGKTVCFSAIANRYKGNNVLILVHRRELLRQTQKTLLKLYGINAGIIKAGMRSVRPARVYVGMVESFYKRKDWLTDIGLVIIDECHIASFNKVLPYFPDAYIIGFSATPISSNKKKPMKMFYDDIVCGIDIPDLIKQGFLTQNITYAPRDIVERASLTVRGNDFDDRFMSSEYSKPRYIKSTVSSYEKWCAGKKTLIFNCSVEHSIAVNNAFRLAGYNSRHLDGEMTAWEREQTLKWFADTPGAILNSIGILTTGFDEPSVEAIVVNKATQSLPLWKQMTGRCGRIYPGKQYFTIVDMGGNAMTHGDWCDPIDWADLFYNPKKASKKEGVAPVKYCPCCDGIISVQCKTCPLCGYEFPAKQTAEEQEISDFIMITKGIDVKRLIYSNQDKKEYFPFFALGKEVAAKAKKTLSLENLSAAKKEYDELARQWCEIKGKKYNKWHQQLAHDHLKKELESKFKIENITSL